MPLSQDFLTALEEGHLSSLRSFLLTDRTLSPEIRQDTLTIYYRGGRLLKLQETDKGYTASFDPSYVLAKSGPWYASWAEQATGSPSSLNSPTEVSQWLASVPFAKAVMDRWFVAKGGLEREAQQLIVRENNQDGDFARATDYFFCDMERVGESVVTVVDDEEANHGLRFDLVGVHWPSTPHERRKTTNRTLVIAEAKYGDGAHAGDAGIVDHFRLLRLFISESGRAAALKQAMVTSFQQKHRLGFIQCQRPLESFTDERSPIIWLLILINHDPEKTALRDELQELSNLVDMGGNSPLQVRVAASNFMGYGLWDEGIADLSTFLGDYGPRILKA